MIEEQRVEGPHFVGDDRMSPEDEGHLPPPGSGKKLVIGLVIIVVAVSTCAASYGLYLRAKIPHSQADHHAHDHESDESSEHEEATQASVTGEDEKR